MLPIQYLKRYFPNTPDWILGGIFLTGILWLIVLPIEIVVTALRQEYIPTNFAGWIIRFPYIWGYAISLFLIPPLADYHSLSDQLGAILIMLLGLSIVSPAYFVIGLLLAARKIALNIIGVLLGAINIISSCLVTIWLIKFLFSG